MFVQFSDDKIDTHFIPVFDHRDLAKANVTVELQCLPVVSRRYAYDLRSAGFLTEDVAKYQLSEPVTQDHRVTDPDVHHTTVECPVVHNAHRERFAFVTESGPPSRILAVVGPSLTHELQVVIF